MMRIRWMIFSLIAGIIFATGLWGAPADVSRIKSIRIHGGFPLLEKEIRNVMTIIAGDVCVPEKLPAEAQYVTALFSVEGYIHPQVRVTAEKDPKDGHCNVTVDIRKGPFYSVAAVTIEGNTAFSGTRLKMRLGDWRSSMLFDGAARFVQKELTRDIKNLRQLYRKKGYAEVSIAPVIEKDPETGAVRICIRISEGPHYQVSFAGNEAFRDFTLKKDLVLLTEGNQSGFGIRKSIRNIEKRYRAKGFLDVRVTANEPPDPSRAASNHQTERPITFVIKEGPHDIVKTVTIDGNAAFDDEKIKKQMLTAPPGIFAGGPYVPETVNDDMRAISALYMESGFGHTAVDYATSQEPSPDDPEIIEVTVAVFISEGPQTMTRGISIDGTVPLDADTAVGALSMSPGTPFRPYMITADRNALAARISEKGYPHVTVDADPAISPDHTSADITYTVDPGPFVQMGDLVITGNFKTREHILTREMELMPGDPFSLSKILASQRNIRNLEVLDSVRFETTGLEEKADHADMLMQIEERKPYFAELAAGYDTRRLFYINTAAGNSNLLGLNKELRAALEWSQIGYRAELGLTEPRFLGTRIASRTNVYTEKIEELNIEFGIRSSGASTGFSRRLTDHLTASLNFQFEYREQYRTDGQPIPEDETEFYNPRSILVTTPSLVYNSTDSFMRPTRGARITVSTGVSKGLKNSLDDFFKYRLDTRYYYSPVNRLTLAVHGRFGYIDPFGSKSRIPEDQLFFLGGIANVRGFSENRLRFDADNDPVGGRTAILGSAEARFDMGMNFELAVFYDTGTVQDPLTDAGSDDFRSSAGLGLRYITPIGPIGGMYGWKLDRKPGESPGAFHFAIGYTF